MLGLETLAPQAQQAAVALIGVCAVVMLAGFFLVLVVKMNNEKALEALKLRAEAEARRERRAGQKGVGS